MAVQHRDGRGHQSHEEHTITLDARRWGLCSYRYGRVLVLRPDAGRSYAAGSHSRG